MAKGNELATAYLTLVPSLKGAKTSIEKQLKGVDTSAAGRAMGDSAASGFGSGFNIKNLAVGAAITAGVAAGKQFLSSMVGSFSDYEQLEGGMAKMFDEMDSSAILADAQNAYKELNMSANEYLATINQTGASFAATMGDQAGYETARKGMLAISDYASGTGRNIDELSEKFSLITRSTASYQSIADQFSGILPATSADFLEQAQAAGVLSDSYTKLTEVPIDEYQRAVAEMLEKGVTDLGLAGNTAAETAHTVAGSIAGMKSAWSDWMAGLSTEGADMTALSEKLASSAEAVISNVTPVIVRGVGTLGATLASKAPEIASRLYEALMQSLPESVSGPIRSTVGKVGEVFGHVSAQAQEVLAPALDYLSERFTEAKAHVEPWIEPLTNVSKLFGNILVGALSAAAYGLGFAMDAFSFATDVIMDFDAFMNGQPSVIGDAINGIIAWFQSIPERITGVFSNAKSLLYQAGQNIIQGLADGIKAAANRAVDSMAGVLSTIREYLPFSPAKVGPFSGKGWTLYSGQSMMESLADGIKGKAGIARDAMNAAMGGIAVPALSTPSLATAGYASAAPLTKRDIYEAVGTAVADALGAQGDVVVKIGEREFGRAVRKVL